MRITCAGLVVGLGRVGLLFGLVSGCSRRAGFIGNFPMSFPVSCMDGLHKFPETGKGVWLVMVDHVIFDMFGKSIVSLSTVCCFAPLDAWLAAGI